MDASVKDHSPPYWASFNGKIYAQSYGRTVSLEDIYIFEALNKLGLRNEFKTNVRCSVNSNLPEMFSLLSVLVKEPYHKLKSFDQTNHVLIFSNLLVRIDYDLNLSELPEDPLISRLRHFSLELYGEIESVKRLYTVLRDNYPYKKPRYVQWWFDDRGSIESKDIELPVKNIPKDSYYPWIKPDIEAFQQAYLESDANLLLLLGPPGGGKSSWIRNFIHTNDLQTIVSSDEEIMIRDQFFARFMTSDTDVLVLEDADVLLRDRSEGNKVMSKLLNTSDGLIQTKKKIIMTANITHLDEIDPALIRPGRCFETLLFRELTHKEAVIAARDAGVPEPDGNVTLSQLFQRGPSVQVGSRIGF